MKGVLVNEGTEAGLELWKLLGNFRVIPSLAIEIARS